MDDYKGFAATIRWSDEDGCYVGHIADIDDIVGFHGDTVKDAEEAFREAVDDYLEVLARII